MKVIGWLTKTILTTVLICSCTMITTYALVTSYANRLLGSLDLQLGQGQSISMGEMLSNLSGVFHTMSQESASGVEKQTDTQSADPAGDTRASPERQTQSGQANASAGETSGQSAADGEGEPSMPVFSQSGEQSADATQSQLLLSAQDIYNKKEQISNQDKLTIFSILSKLPTEDMQKISSDLEDGITADELRDIESIVQQNISQDDYQHLIEILNKY